MKVPSYSVKNSKKGTAELPEAFVTGGNDVLLAQAIRVYTDRSHLGLRKTKTRGEVSVSTRKIYKQKGTGGARHGAKSAPIFVGGGTAHGPKGIKRVLELSQKMRQKALAAALARKVADGKLVVAEGVETLVKTKEAAAFVSVITKEHELKQKAIVVFAVEPGSSAIKALRNLPNVQVVSLPSLNPLTVHKARLVIIDQLTLPTKTTKSDKKETPKAAKKTSKKVTEKKTKK